MSSKADMQVAVAMKLKYILRFLGPLQIINSGTFNNLHHCLPVEEHSPSCFEVFKLDSIS